MSRANSPRQALISHRSRGSAQPDALQWDCRPGRQREASASTAAGRGDPESRAPGNYSVLAVDVDGTLAGANGLVTARTIAALRAMETSGVRVVIVTGRAYPAALWIWSSAQLSAPLISCGGALVVQPPTLKAVRTRHLPMTAVATCVRLSFELGVELSLWTEDAIWVSHQGAHAERLRDLNHMELRRLASGPRAPMPLGPMRVLKAMFGGRPASLDRAQRQIADALSGVEVTRAMPEYIDVVAHGSSKHDAIGDVLAQLEVSPDQMVAIGDGDNDVGMLTMAALAVVPANAMKRARDVADLVVGHHDREGVARFLEDLLAAGPRVDLGTRRRVGRM